MSLLQITARGQAAPAIPLKDTATAQPDLAEAMYRQLGNKAFEKAPDGADGVYWMEKKGNTRSVQLLKYHRPTQKN